IANILIQVNIAHEDTKFGIDETNIYEIIDSIKDFKHIKVKGLMTIAPFVDDPEENRVHFKKMKQLLLDIKSKNIDNIDMNILSMGMTNDYMVAIEEGATMVRVGTGIFGERNYNI
ncbi:MAG: YggS family pyridoxal phosphate-dependent enzyme, partial [Lachnospiraceae bacterium]|nr:YggS family pyridoxal phosphate-dependent enzyme [Lachnospiraceae bacterium]